MSDKAPNGSHLLRPADAAAYLAISTRQLRNLTQGGEIRYVNIGMRDRETRRYTVQDLDAFIADRTCFAPGHPLAKHRHQDIGIEVIDFQARRDARIAERAAMRVARNSAKPKPPKPRSRTRSS